MMARWQTAVPASCELSSLSLDVTVRAQLAVTLVQLESTRMTPLGGTAVGLVVALEVLQEVRDPVEELLQCHTLRWSLTGAHRGSSLSGRGRRSDSLVTTWKGGRDGADVCWESAGGKDGSQVRDDGGDDRVDAGGWNHARQVCGGDARGDVIQGGGIDWLKRYGGSGRCGGRHWRHQSAIGG